MKISKERAYALKLVLFDVFVLPEWRQDTLYTYQDDAWSFFGYWDGTVHADPLDDGSWYIHATPLSSRLRRILQRHLPELYGSQPEEPALPFEGEPWRARMTPGARPSRGCRSWKEHRGQQWRAA